MMEPNPYNSLLETDVENAYRKLKMGAETGGYFVNPDIGFTKTLIRGRLKNKQRYGYESCPCRLASGNRSEDIDIICPCDYRDEDIAEYQSCFCGMYVNEAILLGEHIRFPVPERRASRALRAKNPPGNLSTPIPSPGPQIPEWRCRVCGYLCAREEPPEVCPICKAAYDRFERFR
jgi:ferredoxin-thioredoxin reductase catalytic chain